MLPVKIYNLGIISLVLLYLIVNIKHKKPLNVIIFLISYIVFFALSKNHYNSLVISYIISIVIGICRNFHLLENFELEYNIEDDENTVREPKKKKIISKKNNKVISKKKKEIVDQENELKHEPKILPVNLKSLISDDLLEAFIQDLKNKNIKVIKKKISIFNVNPTIKKLDRNKINNLQKTIKEQINTKPIVVSKDLFIIDGHHRWYAKKIIVNDTIDYDIDSNVEMILIDIPIKNVIKEIKNFKINHNENQINDLKFDKKKLLKAKEFIETIKVNIHNLENYYAELNKLKLY